MRSQGQSDKILIIINLKMISKQRTLGEVHPLDGEPLTQSAGEDVGELRRYAVLHLTVAQQLLVFRVEVELTRLGLVPAEEVRVAAGRQARDAR